MNKQKGFTLVELMVVVAIAAIIAAVAIPSYFGQVLKAKRAIGKAELMEIAARQEQYFVNNKTYTDDLTDLGYPAADYYVTADGDASAAITDDTIYLLDATTANGGLEFTLKATPQKSQTKDTDCKTLGLDEQGLKYQTDGATAATDTCW
ncbi:type IV pilin protein [Porticoccaceae bacterium LTM1]|nr:type IV pilin protein [Porticoccaceae bacterium LTM1]